MDPECSQPDAGRAMLIGDIRKAFFDAGAVDRYPCEVWANILDGIAAAAKGRFEVVGVVMDGTANQLGAALRALRRSTRARIVLLARMHEEPIARRLISAGPGEEKQADEYLICPARLASFWGVVRPPATGADSPPEAVPAGEEGGLSADLERRMRHLERLATTDDLTGLKNRRYTWEFAAQILRLAGQTNGRVTLLVFDIDDFKHYNDVYGHVVGDEILREAAILMRRCCRPHDVVGRIGGDEFAVVFWDDPCRPAGDVAQDRRSAAGAHPTEAISVARRFQKEFGNADLHLLGPGGEGILTISGGLASFPRDGTTVPQLFERADFALLDAKRRGKNRIYLVGEPQSDIAEIE
jgi:diguanylate cyclase (GGDEF)-like protein